MSSKITDPVIEEIHQARAEITSRFGGNIKAIAEDAAQRQKIANRPVWQPNSTDSHVYYAQKG